MLCGIADVYDAMRSHRAYQQSFPTDRILQVLKRNDGQQFDQNLVRRFVQLLGHLSVGNSRAAQHRRSRRRDRGPRARTPIDRTFASCSIATGTKIDLPYEVNLWEARGRAADLPSSISAPLNPADYDIDPLTLL